MAFSFHRLTALDYSGGNRRKALSKVINLSDKTIPNMSEGMILSLGNRRLEYPSKQDEGSRNIGRLANIMPCNRLRWIWPIWFRVANQKREVGSTATPISLMTSSSSLLSVSSPSDAANSKFFWPSLAMVRELKPSPGLVGSLHCTRIFQFCHLAAFFLTLS